MLKQPFAFFPPFVLGNKSVWKISWANSVLSIHWVALPVLVCVSVFISCLFSSYLTFLIHKPLSWNVWTHHGWTMAELIPKGGLWHSESSRYILLCSRYWQEDWVKFKLLFQIKILIIPSLCTYVHRYVYTNEAKMSTL